MGLIGVYYFGMFYVYFLNGLKLWENVFGYVVKFYLIDGGVFVGSLGGLIFFDNFSRIFFVVNIMGKFYDFMVKDGVIYVVGGDYFIFGLNFLVIYRGSFYVVNFGKNLIFIWNVFVDDMFLRVRVGKGVIYVFLGFLLGYFFLYWFGLFYVFFFDGRFLWNIIFGYWVRDMEVWNGSVFLGMGFDNLRGEIYLVFFNGEVLMKGSVFYVEDIFVVGDIVYVLGYNG